MAVRDAEMAEVFIVLDGAYENRLAEAMTALKLAGVIVDHADDDNSVVEGTCETRIIPAVRAMDMVKYVRVGVTWWADYPKGDPRDIIEPIIRRAELRDAARLTEHMKAIAAEATHDTDGAVPLALLDAKVTLDDTRKRLGEFPATGNSLCLLAEVYDDLVGCLQATGGILPAYRHAAILTASVRNGYHGKGIGAGLLQAAIDWAKATTVLRRLEVHVSVDNERAISICEKAGFAREGIRRQAIFHRGQFHEELSLSLIW